jgi:flagellar biosynthesis protein FlhF
MQIKKYTASSLKEATDKMKKDLGSEAIVLSTRVIEGQGGSKQFELTAGVEEEFDKINSYEDEAPKTASKGGKNFSEELQFLTDKIYQAQNKAKAPSHKTAKPLPEEQPAAPPKGLNLTENDFKEIYDQLVHREVSHRIAEDIITQLKKYGGIINHQNVDSYVISIISSMLPISKFEFEKQNKPKVVAVVGPTGVGKTTCIAKLAVISKILHKLNVGLISIDTYRLGAIDQLKIFSEIANVEMAVAYEPEEMKGLLNQFKKKDIVFIDTAGRSQNNKKHINDMNPFLSAVNVDEVYLVLSAASAAKTMVDVADKFKAVNYNGLVLTKLDEAVSFGGILNVSSSFGAPIKYLTNGQVIPDDIIAAESDFIANLVYTGKLNK